MIQPAIVSSPRADRSGRGRRVARTLREVALVPALVVLGFAALATLSILADQTQTLPFLDGLREAVSNIMGAKAANAALQAVATGLLTVTSITFSVLLLAVQQTASNLSPVVFNQFLQRRSNQVYLGFFVGLALYSYVVMAAVQDSMPPIIGAAVAVVLTLVALAILLILVYSTVVQMRPTSVLRAIHDRTLQARHRELDLVRRTRRASESRHPVQARYVSLASGYVSTIDVHSLARHLESRDDVEVELHVTVGTHVGYGDLVASVRDGDADVAKQIATQVALAIELGPEPDLSSDATTGISEIGNIAWTSGSTSKHNPEIARQSLNALTDIASRWLGDAGGLPALQEHIRATDEVLPVVYEDNDLDRVLEVIYGLLVSAHESHQHHLTSWVLDAYASLLPRAPEDVARRMERDLDLAKPLIDQMPPSPMVNAARDRLDDVRRQVATAGEDATADDVAADPHPRRGKDHQ
ncbi:MAG: DUF2254 family protein [Actinomycetes bacterium]